MTIHVDVHLHAGLQRFAPDAGRGQYDREFPDGARVSDVLASFGLPPDRRVIVGVNGQQAHADDPIPHGARIDLVPPIAGG